MPSTSNRACSLFASFFILLLAQPDFSPLASILAAILGYALFFKAALGLHSKRARFLLALGWFFLIQMVHLSWFTADRYVGIYIYPVYLFLCLWFSLQFAILTLFVKAARELTLLRILAICSFWALSEWSRLYFLSGFSFNPSGLALTATLLGMQALSVGGIFALSFWVMLTNLLVYKYSSLPFKTIRWGAVALVALMPYLYGGAHLAYHQGRMQAHADNFSVLLVQTALNPEQKVAYTPEDSPLSPWEQWDKILSMLKPFAKQPIDFILFPEATVPYGANYRIYQRQLVEKYLANFFEYPLYTAKAYEERVGNRFWAQNLANFFDTSVIIGLEDAEFTETEVAPTIYNAAFVLSPFSDENQRYEKRVLVPMGEYIPFAWCKKILLKYGIRDSYERGREAKVFETERAALGISICYEETFGHLMRQNRLKGADLLVNLTNDVWYPRSRLPYVHYLHGRMRSVESGIPLIRACNTGVTCGIDSLGRTVGMLEFDCGKQCSSAGVCHLQLSGYHYSTLYTYFGDWLILFISLFFVFLWIILRFSKLTD